MDVARRTVQFIELGEELTLACLVCEDLAQNDDVAEVIRSVGPTLVVTPLLDGPQLTVRWAARYASVLADDPGSVVATLSAYGMVQRCRPYGEDSPLTPFDHNGRRDCGPHAQVADEPSKRPSQHLFALDSGWASRFEGGHAHHPGFQLEPEADRHRIA